MDMHGGSDNFAACAMCETTAPRTSTLKGWVFDREGRLVCGRCVSLGRIRLRPSAPAPESEVAAAA